ncbi:MAG: beta-mannanase [Actinomycetota bacterium]|nr:beta-mannanase [Actinomycetota bacterium]
MVVLVGAAPANAAISSRSRTNYTANDGVTAVSDRLRPVSFDQTSLSTPTQIRVGVATPDLAALDAFRRDTGATVRSFTYYRAWATSPTFDAKYAAAVAARGAVPSVTWEPWHPANGVSQPAYSLRRIAAGAHDTYLKTWASGIRAYGRMVELRFAHEMNGTWYPWGVGVNGNTAADYVAAWRHVHAVFRAAGVTNVRWIWSPNVSFYGSTPLARVFPGSWYVHRVGLDGYNGGAVLGMGGWKSFREIFGPSLNEVRSLTSRPIMVSETGSIEVGGDKAAWITDFLRQLAAEPGVVGFTWFNFNKEAPWLVQSSVAATRAFATGVAAPVYR